MCGCFSRPGWCRSQSLARYPARQRVLALSSSLLQCSPGTPQLHSRSPLAALCCAKFTHTVSSLHKPHPPVRQSFFPRYINPAHWGCNQLMSILLTAVSPQRESWDCIFFKRTLVKWVAHNRMLLRSVWTCTCLSNSTFSDITSVAQNQLRWEHLHYASTTNQGSIPPPKS